MAKVYFIGGQYESCHYVRCLIPMIEGGWDGDKTSLRSSKRPPEEMMKGAMHADVVVFHRPVQPQHLEAAKLLKQAGKKIVMDNDDTYRANSGVPVQMFGEMRDKLDKAVATIDDKLKEFAKICDLVTVTTEFLKEEYKDVCPNVVVLPNCVDLDDWETPLANDTGKVRIGVVGSVASNLDYEPIKPLLLKLKDRADVQVVLVALPPNKPGYEYAREVYKPEIDFWTSMDVEWHSFTPQPDYLTLLTELKLDIMLIPRHDNYFNRCKSNLKFLEASMCEMVTIAQSFPDGNSPYEVNESDRDNLILATTAEDWIEKTLDLVENKEKRVTLAKKAKRYVTDYYNITNNINLWEDEYNKICKDK